MSQAKAVRIIKNVEQWWHLLWKLKQATAKKSKGPISKVILDNGDIVDDSPNIQQLILNNNRNAFNLGTDTIPTNQSYISECGIYGEKEGVETILNGSLPNSLNWITYNQKLLFQNMKWARDTNNNKPNPIDSNITGS